MSHDAHHSDHAELGHIVPFAVYMKVFIALVVLTILTVAVSQGLSLGNWNVVLAIIFASAKAILVALFFMHLKFEDVVTWIYAIFPIVLLLVLFAGVFIDNPYREDVRPVEVIDTLTSEANADGDS
jgi:cytochrome c oxidase subunit IV